MVFFLYGQDTYRSRQKLRELKDKFVREVDPSGVNLVVLDGAAMKPEDFRNAVSVMSMFVKKRMVVVERLGESGKKPVQEAVAEYLEHKDFPEDHIVVFWEGSTKRQATRDKRQGRKQPKKKSPPAKASEDSATSLLFDVLRRQKYVQEFAPLTPLEVEQWVVAEVKEREGTITRGALQLIAASVGNDLWRMTNEIEKLLAGDRAIIEDAVRTSVIPKTESAIFDFVDALALQNEREALLLLSRERDAGAEPLYLLSMMARQFRILLSLAVARRAGVADHALASTLSLHPFVVQKATQQLRGFSFGTLKNIYRRLLEIDVQMKTSRVDPDALLTLFVTEVASA